MKLIIDIDEELYAKVPYLINKGGVLIRDVLDAVEKGTPLEAQPIEECEENGSPWCLGHCPYNTDVQPTDAEREAYIKGYDYGVKDWFKSKTQPTNVVDRDAVINLVKYSLCDLKRDADKQIFINTINSLPSVTPRTSLAETSQNCISILNRIMEYTYGMLTAEKYGLQHLIKSMMDELRGDDSE